MEQHRFAGWFPIRVYGEGSQTMVDWCRLGEERFDDPFFAQTVGRCLRRPFNLAFRKQTPIEALEECEAAEPGLEPSGFIFHLSRCGSTLLGRMLGALDASLVMSEPHPVDTVLRAPLPGADEETRLNWFGSLVRTLGRRWRGDERRYFIKFDTWTVQQLPAVRRAFPNVPWIFLYRDPVEVLVSHEREQSYLMLPVSAPAFFGMDLVTAATMPPLEYRALILSKTLGAASEHVSPEQLINYTELPAAAWERVAPLFGCQPSDAEIERMRAVAGIDVKRPEKAFAPDGAGKQREAPVEMRAAVDRWVTPLYRELERRRLGALCQ
jgi:hypothetical protein